MDFLNKYKQIIDEHEIISFDIFDTLLLRPYVSADDLFRYIETVYKVKNFAKIRKSAEKSARKHFKSDQNEDINLDEIYSFIPEDLLYLKNIEIELDLKQTILNKEMFEVYSYALNNNKKIMIISDMYLSTDNIKKMLEAKGISKFDEIFVSSDCRKLKHTGNMFKYVLDKTKFSPEKILHIGDNKNSDYNKAIENNIDAICYTRVFDKFIQNNSKYNKLLKKGKTNLLYSILLMLTAIYENENSFDYWKSFGYLYTSAVCLSFLFWINKHLEDSKIKDIIFIARDGYLLQKIQQILFGESYNTFYIYAPRLLNLCISLDLSNKGKYNSEHTKAVIDYYRTKSESIKNVPFEEIVNSQCAIKEKYKTDIENLKENEISNYKNYLAKFDFNNKNIAVVDSVSLFFSAQKLFESVCESCNFTGFYYQIQKKAKLKNICVNSFKPIGKYSRDCKLIEFMLSSPEPPIQSILEDKPVYKNTSQYEENRINMFKSLEIGCLQCVNDIKNVFSSIPDELFTEEAVTDLLMNLVKNPEQKDKDYFSQILFAYDTQHENYVKLFPKWYKKKFSFNKFIKGMKND